LVLCTRLGGGGGSDGRRGGYVLYNMYMVEGVAMKEVGERDGDEDVWWGRLRWEMEVGWRYRWLGGGW
jgi:hypothetical protein